MPQKSNDYLLDLADIDLSIDFAFLDNMIIDFAFLDDYIEQMQKDLADILKDYVIT